MTRLIAGENIREFKEDWVLGNSICQSEAKQIDGENFLNSLYDFPALISNCF